MAAATSETETRGRSFAWAFGLALALFVSGGASNLDRPRRARERRRFHNIGAGSLRTGIFKVADAAIMLGAAIVMVAGLRTEHT